MSTKSSSKPGTGFLTFNSLPPRLWLTGPSPHPPEKQLLYWKEEGYDVTYLPYTPDDQASYTRALKSLHDDLELGETYAIVCYGAAATAVLKTAQKPMPKCCAIVAFYPSVLPDPRHKFPSLLQVVVHVAGLEQISPPAEQCAWRCYRYEKGRVGFADPEGDEFEEVEAGLAWSRSLACVRRGFKMEEDVEEVADRAWRAKYEGDPDASDVGAAAVVTSMTQDSPHVTIFPTLEGGVGRKKLNEFYREYFIPSVIDDFDLRLVSRTVGVDRVVDEMLVSFTHTDDMDWILPGVAPTNKRVEIPMVSIVAVRGGKLVSEHMYWDQASVLVQVGLLDPKVVPKKFKNGGFDGTELKRLPAVGVEAAMQLLDPQENRYNELLRESGLVGPSTNGLNGANGA
ncbi:dienelactone hydrolase [Aaosphaeria arxii CBS 175.79]|uniref:Dienelactone hydrolase n=1 Tax=Aaosphaeria arxii CBS 175.79 TaxID=1450172 RepID=A0A6A5X6A5_9PLEO|nr:dienelactone hydrolase [Aaosphaeria arxii CBS 175.79]KAF2008452.1 dienelactone hydrolase [Aaosphaeria arxii CBS 175.79]